MTPAAEHFLRPLSACFVPRPGQDFELFAKQLMEDLESYSESVLSEAARDIRRTHPFPTWPTIAECVAAVERAAQRQYRRPAEKRPTRPEPSPEQRQVMLRRLKALSAQLAANIAMDKPHRIFRSGMR